LYFHTIKKNNNMSYEATGRIVKIYDPENKSGTFQTRDFVIEIPGQYAQLVKFQLTQDRTGIIDPFVEGQEVKVYFDLRGRAWTDPQGKTVYFNSLHCWKIEVAQAGQPRPASVVDAATPAPAPAQTFDELIREGEKPDSFPF
jgi:single-strand DNA-binding protein